MISRSIDGDDDAMVRPPCCDKEGVKKGPWTPEEDLVLVSYIQEHGPGNWRAVPTRTGMWLAALLRMPTSPFACCSLDRCTYGGDLDF